MGVDFNNLMVVEDMEEGVEVDEDRDLQEVVVHQCFTWTVEEEEVEVDVVDEEEVVVT